MQVVRKYGWIRCTHADDSSKTVGMTIARAQILLNNHGAYREKHKRLAYMEVEVLDDGSRNNAIDCYAQDGTHLAQIAYRGEIESWFICG